MRRVEYILYAVVLKEHPHIVKIGRTSNWKSRKRQYSSWNLSTEDAIMDSVSFVINEEYCCLPGLEGECIARMNAPVVKGNEWFRSDIEHAKEVIRQVLIDNAMSCIEV